MEYSLSAAAKATGSSKSLIQRMCKDGRLSYRTLPSGEYRIDASELGRAFSEAERIKRHVAVPEPATSTPEQAVKNVVTAPETVVELAELRVKVQMLEGQLERSDRERETVLETLDDLRKRLDEEREERRNLQRLLAPPVPERSQGGQNGTPVPSTVEMSQEPPAVIEDLRRRLKEAEARIGALAAPDRVQNGQGGVPEGGAAAKPSKGFLDRLLRR